MPFPASPPLSSPYSPLLPCYNHSSPPLYRPLTSSPLHTPFLHLPCLLPPHLSSLRGGYGIRGCNSLTRVSIFNINGHIGPFTLALTHTYGHTHARCQIKSDQRRCKVLRSSPQDRRLVDTHTQHTHTYPAQRSALQDGCGIIRQRSVAVLSRNGHAGGTHQSSTARSLRYCVFHTHSQTGREREEHRRAARGFVQTHTHTHTLGLVGAISLTPCFSLTHTNTHTSFV